MKNKTLAKQIFLDALNASLPKNFMSNNCILDGDIFSVNNESYDLSNYKNIYVFGSGKAGYTMAQEIESILGDRIYKGLVVVPQLSKKLNHIELLEGSHPLPSEKSFTSAKKLLELLQECREDDLFIYLLSGGSSALIELPIEPIHLEDFQTSTQLMLHNALSIHEINSVRKHISQIKGGRLLEGIKAKGIVLVVSDIIDDDLYAIGSAPTYADTTSFQDAVKILQEKNIFTSMPKSVQKVLSDGIKFRIEETPQNVNTLVKHYIIASNTLALKTAYKSAQELGLDAEIVTTPMQGTVDEMCLTIINTLTQTDKKCLLFGGECTVRVNGNGSGGRNQHLVALVLQEMKKQGLNFSFLSAGTDGIDGNSDAAGAVFGEVDTKSIDEESLQDAIANFDTYHFFKENDMLISTGATGTNVIDISIIIKGE